MAPSPLHLHGLLHFRRHLFMVPAPPWSPPASWSLDRYSTMVPGPPQHHMVPSPWSYSASWSLVPYSLLVHRPIPSSPKVSVSAMLEGRVPSSLMVPSSPLHFTTSWSSVPPASWSSVPYSVMVPGPLRPHESFYIQKSVFES